MHRQSPNYWKGMALNHMLMHSLAKAPPHSRKCPTLAWAYPTGKRRQRLWWTTVTRSQVLSGIMINYAHLMHSQRHMDGKSTLVVCARSMMRSRAKWADKSGEVRPSKASNCHCLERARGVDVFGSAAGWRWGCDFGSICVWLRLSLGFRLSLGLRHRPQPELDHGKSIHV